MFTNFICWVIVCFLFGLMIGFAKGAITEYKRYKSIERKMMRDEKIRTQKETLRKMYPDEWVVWRSELNSFQIGRNILVGLK